MRRFMLVFVGLCAFVVLGVAVADMSAQEAKGAPPDMPPARKIPGITVDDPMPNGCVSCHLNYPELKVDARFTTLMKAWSEGTIEPKLLAKAKAAGPEGLTIKGKHPPTAFAVKDVPKACLTCHAKTSKVAPPFARMIHLIHLTGGEENVFLRAFQGECTMCHKLDQKTGAWSLRSGPSQ
jgi:hypothetical protein